MNEQLRLEQLQFLNRFVGNKPLYDEWFQFPKMQVIEYLFGVNYLTEEFLNQLENISIGKTTPKLALSKIINSYNNEEISDEIDKEWILNLQNKLKDIVQILEKIDKKLDEQKNNYTYPYYPPNYPVDAPYNPPYYWKNNPIVSCFHLKDGNGNLL